MDNGGNTGDRVDAKARTYQALTHALQTGVMYNMEKDGVDLVPEEQRDTSPKHLRTGLNSMMVQQAALVRLLQERGVFTGEEYLDAMIIETQREVKRYEEHLTERLGYEVHLG